MIGDRGLGIATREEYLLKKERTKKTQGEGDGMFTILCPMSPG